MKQEEINQVSKELEDILNMMQLLLASGMRLEDPYHILEATKRKDIEIYDYLESLQIKKRY